MLTSLGQRSWLPNREASLKKTPECACIMCIPFALYLTAQRLPCPDEQATVGPFKRCLRRHLSPEVREGEAVGIGAVSATLGKATANQGQMRQAFYADIPKGVNTRIA